MVRLLCSVLVGSLLWVCVTGHTFAGEICIDAKDLKVCVQAKGPCEIFELLPRERSDLTMEILFIKIANKSEHPVRIDPANFMGITEERQTMRLDLPLFESIELRSKLAKTTLLPGEKMSGYLFFPSFVGPLRFLGYRGSPSFEIQLY